eukprot:COSAG01_NODE_2754_length_7138_cov_16.469953_1_plen_82_part_00
MARVAAGASSEWLLRCDGAAALVGSRWHCWLAAPHILTLKHVTRRELWLAAFDWLATAVPAGNFLEAFLGDSYYSRTYTTL